MKKRILFVLILTSFSSACFALRQSIAGLVAAVLLVPGLCLAASFDCNSATTLVEKLICAEPGLSQLDESLSRTYQGVLRSVADPAGLKREQAKWLREVRDLCTDSVCLEKEYRNRLAVFEKLLPVTIAGEKFAGETDCTDRPECWPEGSSMHTGLLLVEKLKTIEKLLVSKHDELVKLVSAATSSDGKIHTDERLVQALEAQQLAWLKYRDDECELIGSLTGAGGTWPSTYANKCQVNLTEQRLRRVRSAIRCIKKIPNEERLYEQNDCLQQLAPLVNE